VRVHTAFLATDARIRDGLVNVINGFPESWDVPSLPATSRLTLVVVFELAPNDEAAGSHDVAVEMWHRSSGEQVATAHITFSGQDPFDGAPNFRSVVIPFLVRLEDVGPHEIRLTKSGASLACVRFVVRVV
jgi:hypothetical protein